jgi:DNA invertase Pin-like site-specific DNA recombinase
MPGREWGMSGCLSPTAKLTEEQVAHIKWYLLHGVSHREVAKAYGVANSTISRISTRLSWGHVKSKRPDILIFEIDDAD